jgi:hypothetical protein
MEWHRPVARAPAVGLVRLLIAFTNVRSWNASETVESHPIFVQASSRVTPCLWLQGDESYIVAFSLGMLSEIFRADKGTGEITHCALFVLINQKSVPL